VLPGGRGTGEVIVLQWPEEADRRAEMRRADVARLLLVQHGTPAPEVADPLEDWIRLPADEADIRARVATLTARLGSSEGARPVLDDDGVLRFCGQWAALSPVEQRLVAALLDRYGAVVGRQALTRAGWLGDAPSSNALDVKIFRLRQRIAPLGLTIRTIRARGYLLEPPSSE